MITTADFMASICDDPYDLDTRLVYADWLMERGDPRGEFIAVQCRIAEIDEELQSDENCENEGCPACLERHQLRDRERELLWHNWPDWDNGIHQLLIPYCSYGMMYHGSSSYVGFGPEGGPIFDIYWCRGFVSEVRCTQSDWLTHGPDIVRAAPVTKVRLVDCEPAAYTLGYGWWITRADVSKDEIDEQISRYLRSHLRTQLWRWYDTPDLAHADLSRACVRWARGEHEGVKAMKEIEIL